MLMLKKKMGAAAEAQNNPEPVPSPGTEGTPNTEYTMPKQTSKELGDLRAKSTSSGSGVFGLKKGPRAAGGAKRNAAEIRAQKDIAEMDLDAAPGANVTLPDPNNCMTFNVSVKPVEENSPWKGAVYDFTVTVPPDYPYKAPKAVCNTMIYHPNIDWEGHVCLNILRADWKPVLTLSAVVVGLATLFTEANPNDPLNQEAGSHLRRDEADFRKKVHQTLKGGTIEFTMENKTKKSFTFPKFL